MAEIVIFVGLFSLGKIQMKLIDPTIISMLKFVGGVTGILIVLTFLHSSAEPFSFFQTLKHSSTKNN